MVANTTTYRINLALKSRIRLFGNKEILIEKKMFAALVAWLGCIRSASQSGEESLYMRRFMPNRTGTFVEIGALDGHTFSNTRVLNKCRGWRGLLVEANLKNYASLLSKMDRPHVKVIHSAVCEPPETWANFTLDGGAVATDISHVSKNFQSRWAGVNHPDRIQRIPCAPMSSLLNGYEQIDFFSLDVEGAEFTVVNTIDFEKASIDTFCIELDGHDPEKDKSVVELLKRKSYKRCVTTDKRNGWFRKEC